MPSVSAVNEATSNASNSDSPSLQQFMDLQKSVLEMKQLMMSMNSVNSIVNKQSKHIDCNYFFIVLYI